MSNSNPNTPKPRDREREELDAPKTREYHSARMTFVNGRWITTETPDRERPIRDREREELDAMIAKNNEWLDAHGLRTIVGEGGLWTALFRENKENNHVEH